MTFDETKIDGLSESVAAARLVDTGPNELPGEHPRTLFGAAADVLKEPMFLLLLACGSIYFVAGDVQEALMLLGFVVLVSLVTLYEERKTERTLEALRDLTSGAHRGEPVLAAHRVGDAGHRKSRTVVGIGGRHGCSRHRALGAFRA